MRLAKYTLLLLLLVAIIPSALEFGFGQTTTQRVTVTVSPQSLDFGSIDVAQNGRVSKTLSTTVKNTGNVTLELQFENPSAPFSINSQRRTTLAPGQEIAITVEFSPREGGVYSDAIIITDRNFTGFSATVELQGEGNEPAISLNKSTLDFGTLQAAPTSASTSSSTTFTRQSKSLTFQIKNVGEAALSGMLSFSSSAFYLGSVSGTSAATTQTQRFEAPFALNKNSTTTVTITFIPPEAGTFKTTVTIASNDPENKSVKVELLGTGTAPEVTVNPSSMRFKDVVLASSGSTTGETKNLTVKNDGTQTLKTQVESLCSEFTTSTSTSGSGVSGGSTAGVSSIEPGSSGTLYITFKPSRVGNYECVLLIHTNDPNRPAVKVMLKAHALSNVNLAGVAAPAAAAGSLQVTTEAAGRRFSFQDAGVAAVSLQVFDLQGHQVVARSAPGRSLTWMESAGPRLPNGVYLALVQGMDEQGRLRQRELRKIVVMQ